MTARELIPHDAIELPSGLRPGPCKTAGLKLAYSPLNGFVPVSVTQVLKDIEPQISQSFREQEYPNGYFKQHAAIQTQRSLRH